MCLLQRPETRHLHLGDLGGGKILGEDPKVMSFNSVSDARLCIRRRPQNCIWARSQIACTPAASKVATREQQGLDIFPQSKKVSGA